LVSLGSRFKLTGISFLMRLGHNGRNWSLRGVVMVQDASTLPHLCVIEHPLAHHALTVLRRTDTPCAAFRARLRELARFVVIEATRDLTLTPIRVTTPITTIDTGAALAHPLLVAPILRAGLAMAEGAMDICPDAEVRHIGLHRDEKTLLPGTYYTNLPDVIGPTATVLIVDPMLATGGSACAAIACFKQRGARRIRFLSVIAAPEGVKNLHAVHPDVPIYTIAVDTELNAQGFIVPGLGDAGDRAFGTL
jgi:uracil phosphoribosyltransferase